MVTRNLKEFKYGYFEIRAKLPESPGFSPEIWMLRHDIYDQNGIGWPKCGEISILESSSNTFGVGRVYGNIHGGPTDNSVFSKGLQITKIEKKWHLYGMYWTPNKIVWYYDDQLVGEYKPKDVDNFDLWPFNDDFYLIMNLAVGGNLGGDIPDNINEAVMEIDYVRYFSGEGEGNNGDNGLGDVPYSTVPIYMKINHSLKPPTNITAIHKGNGVVDISWENEPSDLVDFYYVRFNGQTNGVTSKNVSLIVTTAGKYQIEIESLYKGEISFDSAKQEIDISF